VCNKSLSGKWSECRRHGNLFSLFSLRQTPSGASEAKRAQSSRKTPFLSTQIIHLIYFSFFKLQFDFQNLEIGQETISFIVEKEAKVYIKLNK